MAAMPNWIDELWVNPHNRQAQQELRQLWLGFQADRKEAWDQLRRLIWSSDKLAGAARAQICVALPLRDPVKVNELAAEALDEAGKMLSTIRFTLPSSTPGVFLPYLRERNRDGRHHWVQRVVHRHFDRENRLQGENLE